jgi:class 3 adenylate cyclase/tetratricopeptide (TPR) repeat protein
MERKLVTILFADAIGSTSLGDRLDPERLRAVLDAYFATMAAAVEAWGGTVEKFIGDAVMAVFGVPAVREDDADRALSAAMEMMQRLGDLNRELQERHGVTLRMRIGVNTGEVVAGAPAEGNQRLVSGDPVNVAARLQAEAEPDTILAGERTYLVARHSFAFGDIVDYQLKGKPEHVRARRVLGRTPVATRGVPGLTTPLVGRAAELQALFSLLDDVVEARKPRLVTVLGPAGVGKSRLVQEFIAALKSRHPQARVLKGHCLSAGHGITYWALGEILQAACEIRLDDATAVALEKLRAVVPDPRMLEALAATAGLTVPGSRLSHVAPQAVAEELAWAWPRFATAKAGDVSVWVIEDLHWAGQTLLEMLERVIARSNGQLLVIGTARPDLVEAHPGFGGGSENFSTLSLRPLSDKHSKELFEALLAVADLPPEMSAEILRKAEGNPFFLEEIVRRLIEEGALVQEGGRWISTTSSTAMPLPDSLLALLSARIDSIPEGEKRVLQEAAVVGRVFWADPVRRFLGEDVTPALLALERRGLISARSNSSLADLDEFEFKHILVRDVAYASLPKARRARAHAESAQWIEEIAGDRTDEFEELLAYHYRSAVAGDDADLAWTSEQREPVRLKAFDHLIAAGVQARRRFAIAKAVELHEHAMDLASGDDERLRVLQELGDDNESVYQGDEAQRIYMAALEIARRTNKPNERARLCSKLVELMTQSPGAFKRSPDPEVVEAFVGEGLAHSVDEEITAHLQVAHGYVARLYRGSEPFGQGRAPDPVPIGQRIGAVEKAREVGVRLQDFQLLSVANFALGVLYGMAGRYDAQLELAVQDLAVVDQLGSRIIQGDAVRRAAVAIMTIEGNYVEGLRLARRSLELSRDTNPHQVMHGTCPVLMALYDLGRWDEIPAFLEEHVSAFQLDPAVECGFVRDGPIIGAVVSVKSGDLDRAKKLASLIADPMDDVESASAWQATLEVAVGRPDNARQISTGKAIEGRSYGPAHARSMLEALIALEDWDEVERFVPLARRHVPGLAILGPCCDRAEGLIAREHGDQMAATAILERALTGFDALNASAEAAVTRRLLIGLQSPQP